MIAAKIESPLQEVTPVGFVQLSRDHVLAEYKLTRRRIQYTLTACPYCKRSIVDSLLPIDAFVTPDDVKKLNMDAFIDGICLRVLLCYRFSFDPVPL